MADINHVVLVGRLTRDAELKYTAGGQAVCKFSLALNRQRKNGDQWVEEAHFFDIVVWGRQGEALNQYLVKGKQVGVDGELRQNRWEQDGQSRSKVEIVANNIQLLGGNAPGGSGGSSYGAERRGSSEDRPPREDSEPGSGDRGSATPPAGGDDHFTDDIPF
ncbi:single-stranded DNA-binding protein [Spirochaetia bacterium]|nr:single-stranded DNA-binding protein [Spirochaetia bacterium]